MLIISHWRCFHHLREFMIVVKSHDRTLLPPNKSTSYISVLNSVDRTLRIFHFIKGDVRLSPYPSSFLNCNILLANSVTQDLRYILFLSAFLRPWEVRHESHKCSSVSSRDKILENSVCSSYFPLSSSSLLSGKALRYRPSASKLCQSVDPRCVWSHPLSLGQNKRNHPIRLVQSLRGIWFRQIMLSI